MCETLKINYDSVVISVFVFCIVIKQHIVSWRTHSIHGHNFPYYIDTLASAQDVTHYWLQ